MNKDVESRLDALESGLVEQDHRLFNVLENFFIKRKTWEPDDPKRKAATKALLWRLFFSPATVAATGGIVAAITVILLFQQNSILIEQNNLIKEQNNYFQEQIQKQNEQLAIQKNQVDEQKNQWIGQRRAQLLEILYGKNSKEGASFNIRARSEAVRAFIDLERIENPLQLVDLRSINLKGADLEGLNLSKTNLSRAQLDKAILKDANFTDAVLDGASMNGSTLYSADFNNTSLRGADFSNVKDIGYVYNWKGSNIYGIKGLNERDKKWIEEKQAVSQGPSPMPPSHIRVE